MNTTRTLWLGLLLTLVGCEVQPRNEVAVALPEERSPNVRAFTCENTGDTTPPEVTLSVPGEGPVSGQVLITAQATDNVLVRQVIFLLNGQVIGSDLSAPFELAWNTREVFNGPAVLSAEVEDSSCNWAVSPSLGVLVGNPGQAAFSAALGVPACDSVASACDSGDLVSGRGPVGPELNNPNTLGGTCVDGALGSYPEAKSLEQLKVFTLDGSPLNAGRRVRLKASLKQGFNNAAHMVDFFHAPDANAPVWTMIASIYPSSPYEEEVVETDFVLPAGAQLQAIRGAYRYYQSSSEMVCEHHADSGEDDYDDLVFAVGNEVDDQPPSLAFIAPADGVTESGAVDFQVTAMDNFAVSRVEFFLDGTLVATSTRPPFDGSMSSGNFPNGTYTVTARAWDVAGNSTTTGPRTLHIANDSLPPTASLLSPSEGATVEGTVSLQATASDEDSYPGGVAFVWFYIDGAFHHYTSSPYTSTWDTRTVPNGPHVVTVLARDDWGNEALASVNVLVDNDLIAPTVSITSPASEAIVTGIVEVTASASDNRGVARVDFFVGSQLLGSDTTAPYGLSWDTRPLVHGARYTLTARAYDAVGRVATHTLGVVVNDATAPTVVITSPTEGEFKLGSFSITANVTDNQSVSRVEFFNGATRLATDYSAPWGMSWNPVGLADGPYTLTVKAYDAVGNVGTASVTITLDNSRPSVSFIAPQAQVVRGNVSFEVSVTDLSPVTKVEFSVNNGVFHTALGAPWTASWDSTTQPDGSYDIIARAYDVPGNIGWKLYTLTVDNTGPTVSLTSPAAGAVIRNSAALTASASDNHSVARVEFYAGSTLVGTDTSAPYSVTWAPPAKGAYTLTAKAYDTAGNATTSAGVSVQAR